MGNFKLMFVGLGNLGGHVLDMFLRTYNDCEVVVAGRNLEKVRQRANLSMLAATHLGFEHKIQHVELDLWNIEETAAVVSNVAPDVIFFSACIQSWWVITMLPTEVAKKIGASHVGPWLPMHLTLIYRFMRAVSISETNPIVINACYPDVVNPVLSKVNLAPTVGIGNIANTVPALRHSMSVKLQAEISRVEVRLVFHHYVSHRVSRAGNAGEAPFHITVLLDGKDVSSQIDRFSAFELMPTQFKRSGGLGGTAITAASAITVLNSFFRKSESVVHAPGPNGLPGGYPVIVDRTGVRLALPESIDLDTAIEINEGGMKFDGIEEILDDGTVIFRDEEMDILRKMLGYGYKRMAIDETSHRALELRSKYIEFAKAL